MTIDARTLKVRAVKITGNDGGGTRKLADMLSQIALDQKSCVMPLTALAIRANAMIPSPKGVPMQSFRPARRQNPKDRRPRQTRDNSRGKGLSGK